MPEPAVRVLIVEDDGDIRSLFDAGLTMRGFVVETAANGRDALEIASHDPPAAIVADLHMPVMDGWSFLRALAGDPRLSQIPVIVLTSVDDPGKSAPRPETILIKPVPIEDLVNAINAAVARSAARAPRTIEA